jgi:enoyl-CoA hydratase/carnithine racemase
MSHVQTTHSGEVGILALSRGKVNAVNLEVVQELRSSLDGMRGDDRIKALVLTGSKSFFSFGFDVPELYPLPRDEMSRFLKSFTDLYTEIFTFPKPVIGALNGHTTAGGCMLALACDRRLMVKERAKISLNEIAIGASVFAGCVEMLRACVGQKVAEEILFTGAMFDPEEALAMGLVDHLVPGAELLDQAIGEAKVLGSWGGAVFASIKALLRNPIAEEMRRREADSIRVFLDVWYSETSRETLKKVEIRS